MGMGDDNEGVSLCAPVCSVLLPGLFVLRFMMLTFSHGVMIPEACGRTSCKLGHCVAALCASGLWPNGY